MVVTGVDGPLGRAVAIGLARRGFTTDVTVTARDPDALADLRMQGLRCVTVDYEDEASLRAAFRGVDRIFLVPTGGTSEVQMRLTSQAIRAAVDVGVARLVYASEVNPAFIGRDDPAPVHALPENLLVQSEIPHTVLRNNEFAEDLDPILAFAAETGRLVLGCREPIAYVARQDVVDSAVEVMVGKGHEGCVYEMSGPEALDRSQIAALLGSALGREVTIDDRASSRLDDPRRSRLGDLGDETLDRCGERDSTEPSRDPGYLAGRPAIPVSNHIRDFVLDLVAPNRPAETSPGVRTVWEAVGL